MNQILVSDKLYVPNKLKKKKKMYKIQFITWLFLVFAFLGTFIVNEVNKNSSEAKSQEMLSSFWSDVSTSDEPLVVALNDTEILEEENPDAGTGSTFNGSYTDSEGTTYTYESVLSIPSIGIEYPVLSDTDDELLKISLNKFWGGSPNSVGNYCIVGHNYRSGKMFGRLSMLKNGDTANLTDLSGNTVTYSVYNIYVVDPDDVACTSQITNGAREMTLITCTNGGKQRLIVKCREI